MSNDRGFVEALVAATTKPHWIHDGREEGGEGLFVAPAGWQRVEPAPPKTVAALKLGSLTALRDYLAANTDELCKVELLLHVETPTSVKLLDCLEDEAVDFRRHCYAAATYEVQPLQFGHFYDHEEFIIRLLTLFEGEKERDELVTFLSSIRSSSVSTRVDSGVEQVVSTQKGITRLENAVVKRSWLLAPYRTFTEIEQPEATFMLRLRGDDDDPTARPEAALFECDGGRWRNTARQALAGWLKAAIPDVRVVA